MNETMLKHSKGFSLIEVLVAALILFIVLSTVTITFTGAVKGTLSATESLKLNSYAPMLAEHVSLLVKKGEMNGSSIFLDIEYSWTSSLIETKEVAPFYDTQDFQLKSTTTKIQLWRVELVTKYRDRTANHSFNVVSWLA